MEAAQLDIPASAVRFGLVSADSDGGERTRTIAGASQLRRIGSTLRAGGAARCVAEQAESVIDDALRQQRGFSARCDTGSAENGETGTVPAGSGVEHRTRA